MTSRTTRCAHCGGLTLATEGQDIRVVALRQLAQDLEGCHNDCWRFFQALFEPAGPCPTSLALARSIGIASSTLVTRFLRRGLPSPKRYLMFARLVHVANALEDTGVSLGRVANDLGYSTQHALYRVVRRELGRTGEEFRRLYTGVSMFAVFRRDLVLPYVDTLKHFRPLAELPANTPRMHRSVAA